MHLSAQNEALDPGGRRSVRDGRRGGPNGRRGGSRTVRIIAELLAFTVLVVATALLLRPLQESLLRRMVQLRDSAIAAAESRIGRRIEYRSMGPSIFGTIDLRDVRLTGDDGVDIAAISRLRIGYSLGDLLSGEGLASVRTLRLDRPVFDIDTARDQDLLAFIPQRGRQASTEEAGSALAGIRVRVRGGSISWKDERSSLRLSNVTLSAITVAGRIELDAGASLIASLPAKYGRLGSIRSVFRAKGDISSALDAGSLTVSVPSFSSDLAELKSQTVLVAFSGKNIEIRKIKGRAPFDLTALYQFDTRNWKVDLAMEEFSPRDVLSFRGPLGGNGAWLDARISGTASLRMDDAGKLAYRVAVTANAPNSGALGGAEAALTANGTDEVAYIANASATTSRGSADFSGNVRFSPFRPEGRLRLSGVRLRDATLLDAEFDMASKGNATTFFADRVAVGEIAFSAVDGSVRPEGGSYSFSVSALRFGGTGGYEDVRLARVSAEGSFSTADPFLQFSIALDAFSAGEALDVARSFVKLPPVTEAAPLDDVSLTTEAFITTDFRHVSYNAPRLVAAYRGGADVFSVASLSGTETRLDLRDGRIIWRGGSVGASASVDFRDLADVSVTAQADYRNTAYRLEGVILDGRTVSIQGDYGIRGSVVIADGGDFSGFLYAQDVPVPLGERRFSASLISSFRWSGPRAWAIAVDSFRLEESAELGSRGFRASVRGAVDQSGAVFPLIAIDDGLGSLSGAARLSWPDTYASVTVSAKLSDALGSERYEFDGEAAEDGISARLYLSKGRLERFVPDPYGAIATGELRLRRSGNTDYEASWRISEIRAKIQGEEFGISGSGTLSPDLLDIEDTRLSYTGITADIGSLRVDRRKRVADASFRIRGTALGSEVDIVAQTRLAFAPIDDWRSAKDGLAALEGTLNVSQARLGKLAASAPFQVAVAKDGSQFTLSGGPNDAIRFKTNGEGAFYAAFSAPSPVRGTLIGTIAQGQIDASANNLYIDFQSLWRFVPVNVVQFTGGIAVASLSVKGPLGDPEFTGRARASGIRLLVPDWVEGEIGPGSGDVVFTGDGFTFGPIAAPAGDGGGLVTGTFIMDRWIPSTFDLSIEVPQESPIRAKAEVAGVVSNGTATGNIRLQRNAEDMNVTGLITVESATIMLDPERFRADQTDGLASEPYPVRVALGLRTGRKVEFSWPSTDLPVLRVSATVGNSLGINYDGLSGRFALKGDVFLRGGEVFYFQRSFYVREGSIRFNESEIHMDPSLSVRAEIRDRYETGPVTIALIVDNAPLSNFTPRLESDPPLSQLEIFSLLGQNLVNVDSQTGTASVQDSLLVASSDILAQFNVIRRFERNARDLLGLDMFSVRTQVLQNAVLDATGLRSEPVDRIGGLGNYFDNTTVYLGKYIGSDLFMQAMFSLRYDEMQADNVFGGLSLEPDIGIELKTPLFLVRWTFLPEHPENMFVNDNSFTLIWKKSF